MRSIWQTCTIVHVLVVLLCFVTSTCQKHSAQHGDTSTGEADTTTLIQKYAKVPRSSNNTHLGTHPDGSTFSALSVKMESKVSELVVKICDELDIDCRKERMTILLIGGSLVSCIVFVLSLYCFLLEDKEHHITPLCPRLLVGPRGLNFDMALNDKDEPTQEFDAVDSEDTSNVLVHAQVNWLDNTQTLSNRLLAIARLNTSGGVRVGSVVARHVACAGQGLAICRPYSEETFAFVVPEGNGKYKVMHRTSLTLMMLTWDEVKQEVHAVNTVGIVVFYGKIENSVFRARVAAQEDAGLVICAVLGMRMHQRVQAISAAEAAKAGATDPFRSQTPTASLALAETNYDADPSTGGSFATQPPMPTSVSNASMNST